MKSLYQFIVAKAILAAMLSLSIYFISCKKEGVEAKLIEITPGASSQANPGARIDYPFIMQATGPFTISPVSATVVKISQQMSITTSSPFTLLDGVVTGYDDLTIPQFPERFFDGSFKFYGRGNDSLFAKVTVQTSVFTDPIDPQAGDFFGSEDFTGTITITGGTGHYLNATGSATYNAHSEWRPPVLAGTIFSGHTAVNGTGNVSVLARNGKLESGTH